MANSGIDKPGNPRRSESEGPGNGNKPYDLHELHLMANNDKNFINHALQIFIENSEEALDKMKKAVKNEDWKLVRETVHKLLPSYIHLRVNTVIPLLYQVINSEPSGMEPTVKTALVAGIIAEIEKVIFLMKKQIQQ